MNFITAYLVPSRSASRPDRLRRGTNKAAASFLISCFVSKLPLPSSLRSDPHAIYRARDTGKHRQQYTHTFNRRKRDSTSTLTSRYRRTVNHRRVDRPRFGCTLRCRSKRLLVQTRDLEITFPPNSMGSRSSVSQWQLHSFRLNLEPGNTIYL